MTPPNRPRSERTASTYCYQCVAGPDLLKVRIEDGIATEIAPNFDAAQIHPAGGKACVKAYGLVQKLYSPHRILQPMKRTNPRKGRDEDPSFVAISWDEALDLVAQKLNAVRAQDLRVFLPEQESRVVGPYCRARSLSDRVHGDRRRVVCDVAVAKVGRAAAGISNSGLHRSRHPDCPAKG
jgi:anaerobic selenocysteine-containing dehydrogenase